MLKVCEVIKHTGYWLVALLQPQLTSLVSFFIFFSRYPTRPVVAHLRQQDVVGQHPAVSIQLKSKIKCQEGAAAGRTEQDKSGLWAGGVGKYLRKRNLPVGSGLGVEGVEVGWGR